MVGAVQVDELELPGQLSGFQLRVIVLCALVAALDGFDIQVISFVAPAISQAWKIPSAAFGIVFTLGLLGVVVGQLLLAPVADRIGRKPVILWSTLAFGLLTLCSAFATSPLQLASLRFFTGLGLGAAMPNIVALTAEYSPSRIRSTCIVVMFAGTPLGGMISSYASSALISEYGWQSAFLIGGIIPTIAAALLAIALPESIQFLFKVKQDRAAGERLYRRISADARFSTASAFRVGIDEKAKATVASLFRDGLALRTSMGWLVFFCSLLSMFYLFSWLPLVLRDGGLPLRAASFTGVLMNAGGVLGSILIGIAMDRRGSHTLLAPVLLIGGLSAAAIGFAMRDTSVLYALIAMAGACIIGGQIGLSSLAASFYPTHLRSTGVGWALGIGRVGSLMGPLLGSLMLQLGVTYHRFFLVLLVPAILGAGAVLVLRRGDMVDRSRT